MARNSAPEASSRSVQRRMQATKQRDTPAEVAVRSALHKRGLRFRVDAAVPGAGRTRPDIVFSGPRIAVFIDGCFWHRCPHHGTNPKSNQEWWAEKLASNVARDLRHDVDLAAAGWAVVRAWEHEDPETVADRVQVLVRNRTVAR